MSIPPLDSLVVRPIRPKEQDSWNALMAEHHYLGFERLIGESLKYVAVLGDEWLALIGWGTAAFKCAPRDTWIGWSAEQQFRRLRFIANNQRFLMLPHVRLPNLASKCLGLNLRRLSGDWLANFGHPVVLAETFVDPSRFRGTCYSAANWIALGNTRGFGRSGRRYYHHGKPKTVWVRALRADACALLSAPFLSPSLKPEDGMLLDLNKLKIYQPGGLIEHLQKLPDVRMRRGIRHTHVSLLAIAICAVLCGNRNYRAIGEWAADQGQSVLKRLGCRRHPDTRRYVAPNESTIRRMLQSVDPDMMDQVVSDWLYAHTQSDAIAVDGKVLRGSGSDKRKRVRLLSALVHKQGVVAAQCEVSSQSNEITAFQPLLERLQIKDSVVTADAMHAQEQHARYLVEEKNADYLFTVKRNQRSLFEDISALDDSDFSPCAHRTAQGPRTH